MYKGVVCSGGGGGTESIKTAEYYLPGVSRILAKVHPQSIQVDLEVK